MRKLTKTDMPDVLVVNEAIWTEAFQAHIAANGGVVGPHAPARYRHDAIRDALREEVYAKCAYCESLIFHVSYAHIEHILPKARRPDLVVRWGNLTLACPKCNQEKGDYYEPDAPLLHPYEDEPEAHIVFVGPMARTEGHGSGYRTAVRLDLNRPDLLLKRFEVLEHIEQLLRQAEALEDKVASQMVLAEAWQLAGEDAEYASMARRYLEDVAGHDEPE